MSRRRRRREGGGCGRGRVIPLPSRSTRGSGERRKLPQRGLGLWAASDFGAFPVQFYAISRISEHYESCLKWEIPILYRLVGLRERGKLSMQWDLGFKSKYTHCLMYCLSCLCVSPCHLCNRGGSRRGLRGLAPPHCRFKRNIEMILSFVLAPVSCRPSATPCSAGSLSPWLSWLTPQCTLPVLAARQH